MDKVATENLFLLEFLVDTVELDPSCECNVPPGETCVSFQFLDNSPLDVCEKDFCPTRQYGKEPGNIKSGKSCLFSLTPNQANTCLCQFDIYLRVFKRMQPGWLPEEVEIGTAVVGIPNLFSELVEAIEATEGNSPAAKTLKDSFDIITSTGTNVGKISIYVRMSCFGKLIVTQFQMNLDDKSVLFKDREGKSLYRYKKTKKGADNGKPIQEYNAECPRVPCPPQGAMGGGMGGMNGMGGMGGMNGMGGMGGMNGMGGMGMSPGMFPGMGMNGNYNLNGDCPNTPCNGNNANNPTEGYNVNCPTMSCAQYMQEQMGGMMGVQGAMPGLMGGMMGGQGLNDLNGGGTCPFGPCPMDSAGDQTQNQAPCPECGQMSNAPCLPPGMGMMGGGMMGGGMMGGGMMAAGMMGAGMMGGGMMSEASRQQNMIDNGAPCNECMYLPWAPCMPPQGKKDVPCNECGALPDPPCVQQQNDVCALKLGSGAPPDGNYQEIGASMGGNSLTIRVHKDKNMIEQVDEGSVISDVEGCGCSIGNLDGGKGKRKKSSTGGPVKDQAFAMRPGVNDGNKNQPFSFKMGGCGQAAADNVVVNPPVCTTKDGAQITEISDPDKEVFVLRIGKKSEGMDKKNNLELELCTPKGPEIKPRPKKETRDTQYDPKDAGEDGGKGEKGKKGKKGGKGGKGKGKGKKK